MRLAWQTALIAGEDAVRLAWQTALIAGHQQEVYEQESGAQPEFRNEDMI